MGVYYWRNIYKTYRYDNVTYMSSLDPNMVLVYQPVNSSFWIVPGTLVDEL